MTGLLLRSGIVRRNYDGSLRWPISVSPWWIWKIMFRCFVRGAWFGRPISCFGVFRNMPGAIRDVGTWLPRRWGVQILGLEIGQRG